MATGIKISKPHFDVKVADKRTLVLDSRNPTFGIYKTVTFVRNHTSSLTPFLLKEKHDLGFAPAFQGTVKRGSTGLTYMLPFGDFGIPTPNIGLYCYTTSTHVVCGVNSITSELLTFKITLFTVKLGE